MTQAFARIVVSFIKDAVAKKALMAFTFANPNMFAVGWITVLVSTFKKICWYATTLLNGVCAAWLYVCISSHLVFCNY